ncbi:MAG: tRNA (adenosine(37)-N6)-threonylcarbamoyltransferase complex ATPase subunit type 1 TsaE [Candidatus Babeliales bacterium]|nr:tRNA (adenosine(37)-N6)-threonylcarbamoyltransferase complex ATPase subunit type 1 TsaE [Candidatus Babeliales bacterium]
MNKTIIYSQDELPEVIDLINTQIQDCKIITFTGPLGAGKSTIVRELLRTYNIEEDILSPTFTYVNIYKNKQGEIFYHFDLYRIHDVEEFLMMGFDEYLRVPNSKVFIEWPEVISSLLHENVCHITLDYGSHLSERILTIKKPGV